MIRGLSFPFPPFAFRVASFAPAHVAFRVAFGRLPSQRPLACVPVSSTSGSALVLVLLITALLATVAVSFLSTSRIEQIAAKNFTRQNAAAGLAEMATQQAMAKIALGFNTTGNLAGNYTAVVTTQPGAIHKYFFQNGTVTQNTTVELFSSGNLKVNNTTTPLGGNSSNETANMNQLSNPFGMATGNLSLTGNSSQEINVKMEEINDSNGNLVGRIAYYVDDELTKVNINAATDNRTTLNVSTPRSISLSALTTNNSTLTVNSTQITLLKNIIDGNASNSSNLSNWSHFFRNEQLSANTTFNAMAEQLAQISTAPLSDFHLKYTPWGSRRLHINDEPLDSSGVEDVYAAFSSPHLTNIYGQNFNDKYGQNWSWTGNYGQSANTTVNGLKQTIANMLQMRAPGHHDKATVETGYTGPVISENGTGTFPPSGYYAHVPSGIINEFAIKIDYNNTTKQIYIKPFIEILCPFWEGFDGGNVHVEVTIQSITYTTVGNATYTVGPYTITDNVELSKYTRLKKCVFNGRRAAGAAPQNDNLRQEVNVQDDIIGNPVVTMGDVKLFSGTSNSPEALRDWLKGSFINEQLGNGLSLELNTPLNVANNSTDSNNFIPNFNSSNITLQRIDPRIKGETSWVVAPHTFPISSVNGSIMTYQTSSSFNKEGGHNTWNPDYGIRPRESASRVIPGDPCPRGTNESDFYTATEYPDQVYFLQKLHTLDATSGNTSLTNATFNSPHDLGKVPTNVNWRRLRFMPRHTNENARNLIPDWAMLDAISFSSNNSSRSNLKIAPLNPNGSFAMNTAINNSTTIPKQRNNLEALIKPLELSSPASFKLGSSIARAGTVGNMTFDAKEMTIGTKDPEIRFRGNATFSESLSNNIRNRVWSAQNGTWSAWRSARGWPDSSLVLPGEVTEISGAADYGEKSQYDYTSNNARSIKENEGRLSAFFPGLTLQSNFFTIYAYAQALDNQGNIDSEALSKTLLEVEIDTPATATTPATYKVKKLYTQPIPLGQ